MKKRSWKSAEEKQRTIALQASWEALKKKHVTPTIAAKSTTRKSDSLSHLINSRSNRRGDVSHIPSISDGIGSAAKKNSAVYTGDGMIGVSQMHKSNLVPVFSTEEAIDIAKMRRG